MKDTIATILQSRMDKCTSEQFWAVGVVGALDSFLISQKDDILKELSVLAIIGFAIATGIYATYIIVHRHLVYYKLVAELVSVVEKEAAVPSSMTTLWKPWNGHSLSGVIFYVGAVVAVTIGLVFTYA